MEISTELVKELRDKTGVGVMACKNALMDSQGNIDKAVEILRKKGIAKVQKREGRIASEGQIQSYVHMGGKIGVLVEVNCETDFSANTEDFTSFSKNIAMQIAATNPIAISPEKLSTEIVESEKEIYREQALQAGKPDKVVEKIVEGKLKKFYSEVCLLNQAYIRDPDITIEDLLNELKAKTGENIIISRFARFQLGVPEGK
ncbi:MAG: translation elongation factor Ts [Deltaproteobacteria bacterium]|nr:translation elongation factor Ts [Deltaproteobacteria bacterium]MBW2075964.1 translation elongation factor Ts [Deltaproteobacteria bacterium]MBW2309951.1 translation elongation factor Ts [Deltaproteobacteria bacterium]RLB31577.1 MAG: translation elongation factor Ts [Deltaproteobacteria bacterium]